MESTGLLVLSASVLLTLLLAAIVLLSLQQNRQHQFSLQFLSRMQESQMQQMTTSLQQMQSAFQSQQNESILTLSSALSESQQQSLLHLQTEQAAHSQLLTSTISESTRSSSSAVASSLALAQATTNLLATRDPIAYQMVSGAQFATADTGTAPYTSVVEQAEESAEAETQRNVAAAISAIEEMAGVASNVAYSSSSPGPYAENPR